MIQNNSLAISDLYTGSVYDIITQHGHTISDKAYIVPSIPDKKINGAIKGATNNTIDAEDVYMVVDLTLFGSATDCILFTKDTCYIKELMTDPIKIPYSDIKSAYEKVVEKQDGDKVKTEKFLCIERISTGFVSQKSIYEITPSAAAKLLYSLAHAVQTAKNSPQEEHELIKRIPLEQMPDDIKINYVKAIIALFMDDGQISSEEFAQIYALIARLNLNTEIRHDLIFLNKSQESAVDLIKGILPKLDDAAKKEIIHSLGKDMIYVLGKTSDLSWEQSPTICQFIKAFDITKEQVQLYIDSIASDEKLFDDNVDDSGLENGMRAVMSSAAGVGVPIAALYFSGSVVGLSAAGISSGLAALGFGGLFGLSGMVTGIGALLVIGYGAKKGVDILTGKSDIEKRKKKELMLHAVCNQLNKTINLVIEDIKFFSEQYQDLMARYDAQSDELEKIMFDVKRISMQIKLMSNSGTQMVDRANSVNCLAIKQSIPRYIDEERLAVLTEDATKKKLYGLIMSFYDKAEEADSQGNLKTVYKLKDDVNADELEMIKKGLESIEYFAASSMAMQGFSKLKKSFFS